eukprot:CAMPEP_0195063208 /NCGR_PEP_ID=MMETSP0448-20130528/9627_1 /TAXON_ID=66468 /ORGANISM="Heterocapsa triquestra, Strain CCMP 448" /LENGTH=1045 /DNA_ID=CAMNT_0040094037 /DNA_START=349 /DNA_END=3486 /DNA_ORIENTATION=+
MWSSTVFPFIGVLLWTACKDLYEDTRRKKDDDAENNRTCWRYDLNKKEFVQVRWSEVMYGDLLLSLRDEAFPADVLLVRASGGQAYISTVNLDGETNLKERRAADVLSVVTEMGTPQELQLSKTSPLSEEDQLKQILDMANHTVQKLLDQSVELVLGEPKVGLAEMNGSTDLKTPAAEIRSELEALKVPLPLSLSFENFVPRGCVLRNTPYAISIAAYVGGDTKTRLNMARTAAKVSNMQVFLNRGVQGLVCTLLLFNLYVSIAAEIMDVDKGEELYPGWPNPVVRFLMYWIILYQVVPISLYVCFEMIKLILGIQINRDAQMVDPRTGKHALARTADLVEEMGQVSFIFSDKTGTLTENEMIFARCCIAGADLGDFRTEALQKEKAAEPSKGNGVDEVRRILSRHDDPCHAEVRWFFFCLATCHSAQVEFDGEQQPVFSGSSPDEVAFLDAGRAVGITFAMRRRVPGKSGWELHIKGPSEEDHQIFTVLCEIPFTSERKRMTVVVEYGEELYCICKGADNVMGPLCDEPFSASSLEHLMRYSKLGLRTLGFASKILERDFYEGWQKKWQAALTAGEGREEAMAACAADIEHSLMLAGISAIEDKLQEGVPEAIVTIKAAGIRFWVLTGDKTETAVEIVRACQLFTEDMTLAYMVDCQDPSHALQLLEAAKRKLDGISDGGLIIDGTFVHSVLRTDNGSQTLYELAIASRACVCCRLSPQQKRKLVELVKAQNKRGITLAIGDGANDVSMIQGAHVGVGIRGKEGDQAVQASDIAISQFRFLVPLIMCHGRRAYRRLGVFLCYFLYKHIALAVGDMLWAHQSSPRFGGQIAYPEWLSAAFPGVLTALPVVIVLGFDRDVPDEVANASPELYAEGLERIHFNSMVFVTWVLSAVGHGCIAWLLPSLWVGTNQVDSEGELPIDFWRASCISFCMIMVFVNCRLWMWSLNPLSGPTFGVISLSFMLLLICLFVLGETSLGTAFQPEIGGVPTTMFSEGKYLVVMVVTPLFLLVDFFAVVTARLLRPTPVDLARRALRSGKGKEEAQKN